jgi:predicted SAM-dependent methyltransferase
VTTVGTPLDKRSRLAAWLKGDGIEIGALHRPLAVPPGAQVTYVDRLPEDELRRHYPELDGQPFAPVGMIGTAENLSAFKDNSLDFIIANHLLEHLEDPVAGLIEFHRVLKPDGALFMALPDSRVTFDRDRALTPSEHILDEHRHGTETHRRDHYLDWTIHVENRKAHIEARVRELIDMAYAIHFHVWRADSFLEFFFAAKREAGLDFELAAFAPPEHPADDEFVVVILKGTPARVRLAPAPLPSAAPPPIDRTSLPIKALRTLVNEGPKPLARKTRSYLRRRRSARNGG